MENDKFMFGGLRDAVDEFIEEFEEVKGEDKRSARHQPADGSAAQQSAGPSDLSPWGFVMMNEEERLQLVQRLQSAASAPPPSLLLRWRRSHPQPAAKEGDESKTDQASAAQAAEAEETFEEEEEVRLAHEGQEQTWTFAADTLSWSSSVPFLGGTDRTPAPTSPAQLSGWSLIDRPPVDVNASQRPLPPPNEPEPKKGKEEDEAEPWVTIEQPPPQQQTTTTTTTNPRQTSAEVDKYIKEEFEFTKSSAKELKNADSLRDDHAYSKLKKGNFLSNAKAKFLAQWSSVTIPPDRNKCVSGLRNDIRKGVPDSKRAQVWRTAVGCVEFEKAYPNYYADVVERVFGNKIPTRFYQIPAFGGELRPGDHYLTNQGLTAAARLLWALTMEYPDVDYVPVMPDLVCVLLTFLSEADAYLVAHLLIEQSRFDRWYLSLSNRKLTLFLHTFRSLIEKCLPDVSSHMDILGVEADNFADVWFKRLFIGSLPYLTVLRIVDCYLAEGSHVLYRVGLAILQGCRRSLIRCATATDFVATVEQAALQMQDADALLKAAFGLSFQAKHTSEFDEKNKTKVAGVSEPAYRPYTMPNITQTSELMDDLQFQALWSLIPSRFSIRDPVLLFSTTKHGFSLTSLLEKCDDTKPTVLLVRDKNRRVFGAFSTEGLRLCRQGEYYYGTREDFLFTLAPHVKSWPWLAGHTKHFVRITVKGIKFGDAKGLCLDEELWHGTSERSKTFENDPLSGETTEFECLSVEVWTAS